MFILGHLFTAIGTIIRIFIDVYIILLILRMILSWIPIDKNNQLVLIVYNLTDPVLDWIRRRFPFRMRTGGSVGLDLTPLLLLLLLYFLNLFLVGSLLDLGQQLTA